MFGKIYNALALEIKAFFDNSTEFTGVEVLRSTQAQQKDMAVSTINMVVVEMIPKECYQFIGGVTSSEPDFHIHSYFYDENSFMEDDQGVNEKSYKIVDAIRRYMAAVSWQTTEMQQCVNDYGVKFTLNGQAKSTELSKVGGGIIPGYTLIYESMALDTDTDQVDEETFAYDKLEGVMFIGRDLSIKYNFMLDVKTFIADLATYNALTNANLLDRYYIQSEKKIYTVTAIDATSHLITTSTIYSLVLNDVFIAADNNTKAWFFDGTVLHEKYLITQYQN